LKNFEEKPLDPLDLLTPNRACRIPHHKDRKGGDRTRLGENLLLLRQQGKPGDEGLETGEGEGGYLPAGGGLLPFRGPHPEGSDDPLPPIPYNPSPCIVVEFTESEKESKGKTLFSRWDPLPTTGGISQNPGSPFENRTRGTTKGGKELEGDLSHCDRITVEIKPLDRLYNIVPYNTIGGKTGDSSLEAVEILRQKFPQGKKIRWAVGYRKRGDPYRTQEDLPLGAIKAETILLENPRELPGNHPLIPQLIVDQEGELPRLGRMGRGGGFATHKLKQEAKKPDHKASSRGRHPL
jgi:hypothetical protein